MKKLVITILSVLFAVSMGAQTKINFGGQFSINFDNEHTVFKSGLTTDKENAFMINLKPKVYWNLNDKMQLGGRIGFAFGKLTTGTIYDTQKKEDQSIINRALGWSVSPFFGYRLLNWKIVSIWAEANVFFGQYYNVEDVRKYTEWGRASEYGFQILPVINIDLTEKLAFIAILAD